MDLRAVSTVKTNGGTTAERERENSLRGVVAVPASGQEVVILLVKAGNLLCGVEPLLLQPFNVLRRLESSNAVAALFPFGAFG